MELYIGGCYQGKLEYVLTLRTNLQIVSDGETCPMELPEQTEVLNHYHLLIKRLIECGRDACAYTEELLTRNPKLAIICDEVGMGIVPIDKGERQYREAVGRCCCILAKHADRVERIICGRGMRIK